MAVTGAQRLASLPNVPTYGESNLFSNNDSSWFGLIMPRGADPAVLRRVHAAVLSVLKEPAFKARLAAQGLITTGNEPAEFAAQIGKEIAKMARVAKFANIRLD